MSTSAQNQNTSITYSAEDDLFLDNPEHCQGMNERDSQPIRFPDMDYLETSSDDGEPSRVPMNIRQINANAVLSNSSTETRMQVSETDGNSAALEPPTAAWNKDSNVSVFFVNSQPFAIPPTMENNSQHISLLSPSFHHSGIAASVHFPRYSSDPSSNHSINASNTLRMAAADSTVGHDVTLVENGVENSDQSSPEPLNDSQIGVDDINSQFSTYGTAQGNASSSGRLIASQGEDMNSKSTSLVRKSIKRKLSTSSNVQKGQTEVADEVDKKEKLREKNREYAQQSRWRKNQKMESLQQENNKKDVIIEIYTKLLTIYHKELHNGTEPSWKVQKKTWYLSSAAHPQEIELRLPKLGEDFYQKLGNSYCGDIIHDTSKSIKSEEISESSDQERQIGTANAHSSQNLPIYYEDNKDTHEDVEYVKTTNQNTASASYVHSRTECKPGQVVNNELRAIMKNGNPSVNNNLKMKSVIRVNATQLKTTSGHMPELSQTTIPQYIGSCKPSDSGLPTSPKLRHYVQNIPHAAPNLNHNGANIALCNVSSQQKVSLIKFRAANVPRYVINQTATTRMPKSVIADQPVIGAHGSTLSAVQGSSPFPVSKSTEKSHVTAGNNSHSFQNLEEATSHVMAINVAGTKVVPFREQGVAYQTLRHETDANNVEDLEPSIEIC